MSRTCTVTYSKTKLYEALRLYTICDDMSFQAFHAHDYEESILYYSRSLSIAPLAATFNNRALACEYNIMFFLSFSKHLISSCM